MDYEDARSSYETALEAAITAFKSHLSTSQWQAIPPNAPREPISDEIVNGVQLPARVSVYRKPTKAGDVVRAQADVLVEEPVNLSAFAALLQSPEARSHWDPLVERATTIEQIDAQTQIVKTDFRLGWPVNPRDSVTISRISTDDTSVVYVSTSLPRGPAEPTFLRPVPPYVRAEVALFAWRIVLRPADPASTSSKRTLRVQLLWQWQLKGAAVASQYSHASNLLRSFVDQARRRGCVLPLLTGFGRECDVGTATSELDREALSMDYTILFEASPASLGRKRKEGLEELAALKEARRLERAIEVALSGSEGWDITIKCSGSGQGVDASYQAVLERESTSAAPYIVLRVVHAALTNDQQYVRVKLTITRLVGGAVCRINGETTQVAEVEPRDPSSSHRRMVGDAATSANISLESRETELSVDEAAEAASRPSPAAAARARAVALLIRRCYNYFTSLLQEPEEKWRHLSDTKGVSVSQLASPDPTVSIYRADKTIVGVSIWDVYSSLLAPGARSQWDVQNELVNLVDNLGESTTLWHVTTKAIWPSWGRDAVLVQTSYKSVNSIHVFAFSTDDAHLFPSVPPSSATLIRSQVDVQGWSIEALSPTTTRIALIEQSDSKGWSTKSWTPQHMSSMLAGLGEYTLRHGGPPMIMRQLGAKINTLRYDSEKGTLKVEYCVRQDESRHGSITPVVLTTDGEEGADFRAIVQESPLMLECELRCNVDIWSTSVELTVDPPPAKISCLHRHRLSASGGGVWITLEHETALLADGERITLLVRKGAAKDKLGVSVNGKRQKIDAERLAEDDVKVLAGQKRIRALPIPLDRTASHAKPVPTSPKLPPLRPPSPPVGAPLETAIGAVAQPSTRSPLDRVLDALAALQAFHVEEASRGSEDGSGSLWTPASHPKTTKRIFEPISPSLPLYRAERIIENVSAEQLLAVIPCSTTRPLWDDRIARSQDLDYYGHGFKTCMLTTKPALLAFRPRTFFVASAAAFMQVPSSNAASSTTNVYLIAMASFETGEDYPAASLNAAAMPVGRILLDGWILESLDPYAGDDHPIPSTKCTYITAVDYAGSMPISVASMMHSDPGRTIAGLERFLRQRRATRYTMPSAAVEAVGSLAAGTSIEGVGAGTTEGQRYVWQLRGGNGEAVQLFSDYDAASSTYTMALARLPSAQASRPGSHRSTTSVDPANGILHRPSGTDLRSQASRGALRTMASRGRLRDGDATSDGELVVAETVLTGVTSTYRLTIASSWAAPNQSTPVIDPARWSDPARLPWRAELLSLPSDRLDGDSFSPTSEGASSLLLRITLPIADARPSSGTATEPPVAGDTTPTPSWSAMMEKATLLVVIGVQADVGGSASGKGMAVEFEGRQLKLPLASRSAAATDESMMPQHAQLSRIALGPRSSAALSSSLPSLMRPLARSPLRAAQDDKHSPIDAAEPERKSGISNAGAVAPLATSQPASEGAEKMEKGGPDATMTSADSTTNTLFRSLEALDPTKIALPPFLTDRRFSLGAILIVALLSFLFGSLLRALVGPTDYVMEGVVADARLLQALHPAGRHWRPARKLLEFRLPRLLGKFEFVCVAVDRTS